MTLQPNGHHETHVSAIDTWPRPVDIESIERTTLDAVSPSHVETHANWLLPMGPGSVGRASSAVPLRHEEDSRPEELIAAVECAYQARGLKAVFRLADVPCFAILQSVLLQHGYHRGKPTLTQTGSSRALQLLSDSAPATLDAKPDAGWIELFSGDGSTVGEGTSRVDMLSRAIDSTYASVREQGRVLAAGVAVFSHGWCCIHGLRTDQRYRGKGHAQTVLATLAQVALARGIERVFLQVEEGSTPAIALYAKAGFNTAWRYEYWRQPAFAGE